MANPTGPKKKGPRIIIVNKHSILSILLLIIVVVIITSNPFWRWMYPIRYQDHITQSAQLTEVDPLLIASVIRVESKFRSADVSHAGAIGLMQLMPNTASWIALQMGNDKSQKFSSINGQTDLSQPSLNILLGSWYIHYLTERFDGNQVAAVAAYNGGPKRVENWLDTKTWPGTLATIDRIPVGETRHFVDRVFYNYALYHRIYGQDAKWKMSSYTVGNSSILSTLH